MARLEALRASLESGRLYVLDARGADEPSLPRSVLRRNARLLPTLDTENRSAFLVARQAFFDAQAFEDEPLAVISLPVRVPYGFHGNWIADRG